MPIYHKATRESYNYQGKDQYYWLLGDTKNPPVLIIPGLSGTHTDLLEYSQNLKDDFFCILPDLPGWGESPRLDETHTLFSYAQYLKSLITHLKIKKINIFGHCMGAVVGVEFAYHFSDLVKKLILVSFPYEEGNKIYTIIKLLTNVGNKSPRFFRSILYFWENKYLNIPISFFVIKFKTFRKKINWVIYIFNQQSKQDWKIFEDIWIDLMNYDYKKIQEIKTPVHLVFGEKDVLISKKQVRRLHELIPDATLDYIAEAGHISPVETPGALADFTKKYLLT